MLICHSEVAGLFFLSMNRRLGHGALISSHGRHARRPGDAMVEVKVRAVAQSWIEGTRLQARTVIGERVAPVQWQAPAAGVERRRYGCACGRPGEGSRRIDLVEDGGRCPGIRLCNAHTRMHGVRESCFLGPRRESPLQLRISSWRRGAVARRGRLYGGPDRANSRDALLRIHLRVVVPTLPQWTMFRHQTN